MNPMSAQELRAYLKREGRSTASFANDIKVSVRTMQVWCVEGVLDNSIAILIRILRDNPHRYGELLKIGYGGTHD